MAHHSLKENLFTSCPQRSSRHGSDDVFSWTLFMMLLITFTLLCWMGSFYIFGHPEKSFNYRLLLKLHKITPPEKFELSNAPRGYFLTPEELLTRFSNLTAAEWRRANASLLRNFVQNYHQTHETVPYLTGEYQVLTTKKLSTDTICDSSLLVIMQSKEYSQLLVQAIFPASEEALPTIAQTLLPGTSLKLKKSYDLSAIIHLEKLPEERILVTMIPLLYGNYAQENAPEGIPPLFSLSPPAPFNLRAGFELFSDSAISTLLQKNANIQPILPPITRIKGALESQNSEQVAPPVLEVRKAISLHKEIPQGDQQTSLQKNTEVQKAVPVVSSTPSSTPVSRPATIMPSPTPNQVIPEAIPINKAIPLGEPAVMPAIPLGEETPQPTAAASPHFITKENLHSLNLDHLDPNSCLTGAFFVTASSTSKAVLRYQQPPSEGPVRIILSYGASGESLPEGSSQEYSEEHPLKINRAEKATDGTLNLFVSRD